MNDRPTCAECGCADFMSVRSEALPRAPVTLTQCEQCGTQYSTGVLPGLGLPVLPYVEVTPKAGKWSRFVCWLRGHRLDEGVALGWSGIVEHTCVRCRRISRSTFDF